MFKYINELFLVLIAMTIAGPSFAAEDSGAVYAIARQSTATSALASTPGSAEFGIGLRANIARLSPAWTLNLAVESTAGTARVQTATGYFTNGERVRTQTTAIKPGLCYAAASWASMCLSLYPETVALAGNDSSRTLGLSAMDFGPEVHFHGIYAAAGASWSEGSEKLHDQRARIFNAGYYVGLGVTFGGEGR